MVFIISDWNSWLFSFEEEKKKKEKEEKLKEEEEWCS